MSGVCERRSFTRRARFSSFVLFFSASLLSLPLRVIPLEIPVTHRGSRITIYYIALHSFDVRWRVRKNITAIESLGIISEIAVSIGPASDNSIILENQLIAYQLISKIADLSNL